MVVATPINVIVSTSPDQLGESLKRDPLLSAILSLHYIATPSYIIAVFDQSED